MAILYSKLYALALENLTGFSLLHSISYSICQGEIPKINKFSNKFSNK
jgi:hypothetical protein